MKAPRLVGMFGVLGALVLAAALSVVFWRLPQHGMATLSRFADIRRTSPEPTANGPQRVHWRGDIIGSLAGGRGIAVRREPTDPAFPFFEAYFMGEPASMSSGPVIVEGVWTGMSCAYANTLFGGRCVPEVDISGIAVPADDDLP